MVKTQSIQEGGHVGIHYCPLCQDSWNGDGKHHCEGRVNVKVGPSLESVEPSFEALPCMMCGEPKGAHPFADDLMNCGLWRPSRPDLYEVIRALQAAAVEREVTIETLRTWISALEWRGGGAPAGFDRCPMCYNRRAKGHAPQCNWVEDRAALGEGE